MSEIDGLLDNPHLDEQTEQEKQASLTAIKEDTAAIRQTITQFGQREIQATQESERQAKNENKLRQKQTAQMVKLLEQGIIIHSQQAKASKAHQSNAAKNQTKGESQPLQSLQSPQSQGRAKKSPKAAPSQTPQAQTTADKIQQAVQKRQQAQQAQKSTPKAPLPDGWKRDSNGLMRDSKGRYVSPKELAKHGLSNPKKAQGSQSNTRTEQEAKDRQLLDGLKDIQEAIEAPDDFDPMVNATKEIFTPMSAMFNTTKAVTSTIKRGMFKGYDVAKASGRGISALLPFSKKQAKEQEKQQNKIIYWLRRIWKKDEGGGGVLGKLMMFFLALPKLLGLGLKSMFARLMLGRILGAVLGGSLFKALFRGLKGGLGSLFKGGSNLFKGLFGGAGGLGKGLLKRIPILGSLLAFADGGMAGGIGSIIGGVVGTAFGPVGTVIGALFGEKLGVWLGSLDWSKIGEDLKQKWAGLTATMTEMWNGATQWFGGVWGEASDWVVKKWDSLTQNLSNLWDGAMQSFSEVWAGVKGWFSDLMPDWVKDGAEAVGDKAKAVADKAKEVGIAVKDKAIEYGTKIGEAISSSYESAMSKIQEWKGTLSNAFGNATTGAGDYAVSGAGISGAGIGTEGMTQSDTPVTSTALNSADFAVKNALNTFSGKCAKYVNDALRSVGYQVHGHGKDVAKNLLNSNQGFEEVKYDQNYVPQIGDVMSISGHKGAKDSTQKYGHVAIYTEKGWVSDAVQGNKYGNTGAASRGSFEAIQSGEVVPVIARQTRGRQSTPSKGTSGAIANIAQMGAKQAYNGQEQIAGLNKAQTGAYLNTVISKESGGKLDVVNQYGYTGLYQMGAAALAEAGMIKREAYEAAVKKHGKGLANGSNAEVHKDFLANADNWTIQGGWEAFRQSKALQDTAMIRMTNRNAEMLSKKGVFAGSAEHKAGALMAAHLVGAGGATAYLKHGASRKDANGTSAATYYKTGAKAVAGLGNTTTAAPLAPTAPTNATLPFAAPTQKTAETHSPIPKAPQAVELSANYDAMASTALKSAEKKPAATAPTTAKGEQSISADPITAFLTQNVSERKIAHIVTGGLVRTGALN